MMNIMSTCKPGPDKTSTCTTLQRSVVIKVQCCIWRGYQLRLLCLAGICILCKSVASYKVLVFCIVFNIILLHLAMVFMFYPTRLLLVSQQTRDNEPMLGQCWADVVDGGPTLTQHWFNVACLLGY